MLIVGVRALSLAKDFLHYRAGSDDLTVFIVAAALMSQAVAASGAGRL